MLCCADDVQPLDPNCNCEVCKKYSRAYLHSILSKSMAAGAILISQHNVAYMQNLTYSMRQAIRDGVWTKFVQDFMLVQNPKKNYPGWIVDALNHVGIELL